VVQASRSLHKAEFATCVHVPWEQASSVHGFPSSAQASELAAWMQPEAGSQESVVHPLWSLQSGADPPTHVPPAHRSLVVQASPSLHAAEFAGCVHAPPAHTSSVQEFPSSVQANVWLVWTHPVAGLQESVVQGLASLQSAEAPPTHVPPEQASPVVQALPSSQDAVL
jgi:hypothetical protein